MRPSHDRDHAESTSKEVFPPYAPPKAGGAEEETKKGKAGSVRGPSDTSSFGDKRDPAQNRAGQGRVKERSARKRKPRGGVTSPAGLEALRTHKHAHLGYAHLRHYVDVAKCFDFASEGAPPWQVMKALDNDYKLLGRIRKVVQAAEREAEVDALNAKKQRGHDHVSPDSTPDAPARATDGPSLPSHPEPVPNSLEASLSADKAREAENTALLKAYMKAYPERCAYDGF